MKTSDFLLLTANIVIAPMLRPGFAIVTWLTYMVAFAVALYNGN